MTGKRRGGGGWDIGLRVRLSEGEGLVSHSQAVCIAVQIAY